MFLSPRNNEPPEDTQELVNSASRPNCEPSSTAPSRDMDSGGAGGSVSSLRTSTSDQLMGAHADEPEPSRGTGFWDKCFSMPFLLLLGVTALLVILPLVLPPLPPPPSMLMLVPVVMLLVLLALAFMPTSGGSSGTNHTYL